MSHNSNAIPAKRKARKKGALTNAIHCAPSDGLSRDKISTYTFLLHTPARSQCNRHDSYKNFHANIKIENFKCFYLYNSVQNA